MTQATTYSIFFKGEASEGADLEQVKRHFGKLFKADENKLTQLFSGNVVALKKNIAREEAAKFQQLFKKTGAKIYLKEDVAVTATTPIVSEGPAVSNVTGIDNSKVEQAPAITDEPYQKPSFDAIDIDSIDFKLSPAGADLLENADKVQFIEADIDLSDISLADIGSVIGSLDHKPAPAPPPTDHISAAEAGETLGSAGPTKKEVAAPDTSHLSVAEVGADLQDFIDDIPDFPPETGHLSIAPVGETIETLPDDKPKINPDVSHISLDDSA